MAPIAKDTDVIPSKTDATPRASSPRPDEISPKPQPVALEIPVTVNGARTVEGTDKREPFSEATNTVLVFCNGAVIRLSSSVTAGQLLFLTNEKTKKEVVCQVVKSKNYRSVSGYVELEFTEPVVGFWGMRFPSDRPVSAVPAAPSAPAPVSSASPVTPSAAPPAAPQKPAAPVVAPKAVEPPKVTELKPPAPKPAETKVAAPRSADIKLPETKFQAPAAPVSPASPVSIVPEPPKPAVVKPQPPAAAPVSNLPPVQEPKAPSQPAQVSSPLPISTPKAAAPAPVENSSDALKHEAARLQEQLSALLFSQPQSTPAVNAKPVSTPDQKSLSETAAKVLEISKPQTPSIPVPEPMKPAQSEKLTSVPAKSLFEDEEVKIPSWLEPLARNASVSAPAQIPAPASAPEAKTHEEPKHEMHAVEEAQHETAASESPVEEAPSLQGAMFGSSLLDETSDGESAPKRSSKGLVMGIAATLLLAAGASAYYYRDALGFGHSTAAASNSQPSNAALGVSNLQPQPAASVVPGATPSNGSQPSSSTPASSSNSGSSNAQPAAVSPAPAGTLVAASSKSVQPAAPRTNVPVQPPPKKPSLGEVRLAAPTVNRNGSSQGTSGADIDPAIDSSQVAGGEGLHPGLLAANSKQPAAPPKPIAVGGDVKPARLLSSVPPAYPALAKTQRVSGDVRVDALIDANGHVSTMNVVSGPALLHQAAMDSLRQWKYQPATLDGKAVPMHLTVTIQFRLQ